MNIKKAWGLMGGGVASSAFSDVWGWWRADTFSGINPNVILTDKSPNGRNMTQAAGTMTPGIAANGQARFTGNATTRLTSSATFNAWPCTVVIFYKRTVGNTCGFFGHTGAAVFDTLWMGFESSNRITIYNANGTLNTVADAGADACFVGRIGYGSRISIINGVIQSDQQLASIVRPSAITVTLGTEYRGLNIEWYETLVWDRELSLDELDEIFTYGNNRYGLSIPLFSSYPKTNTVIVTGDSMASGRALRGALDVNVPVEYQGDQTNVKIWYGTPASGFGTSWDTLNLTNNNTQLNDQFQGGSTQFGINISIGKEYVDRTALPINILQSSTGSAGLSKIGVSTYFDPLDNSLPALNQSRGYGNLMKNYWRSFSALQAGGTIPSIKGIVVFLGTNDSSDLTAANNFSTQLVIFANQLRKELGLSANNSKIYFVRMHLGTTGGTYEATIRTKTEEAVSLIPNSVMVDVDGYTLFDGVHINGTGNIAIGNDLAALL